MSIGLSPNDIEDRCLYPPVWVGSTPSHCAPINMLFKLHKYLGSYSLWYFRYVQFRTFKIVDNRCEYRSITIQIFDGIGTSPLVWSGCFYVNMLVFVNNNSNAVNYVQLTIYLLPVCSYYLSVACL